MTLYETTFIINPQTDDATIDRRVKDIAEVINDNQGKIVFEDHMGTRRLAYEINGLAQGYYASFIFEAPVALLPALQRYYKLNEAYIRHLTVRFEGDIEKLLAPQDAPAESARPARPAAAAPAKPEEVPAKAEEPAVEEAEVKPEVEAAPEAEAVLEAEAAPVEEPVEAPAVEEAAALEDKPEETQPEEDEEL